MSKQIKLDARKRVTLGEMASHDYYLGSVDDQGVITLTPAVVVAITSGGIDHDELIDKRTMDAVRLAQASTVRVSRRRLNERGSTNGHQ